jgi:hypothetical protein
MLFRARAPNIRTESTLSLNRIQPGSLVGPHNFIQGVEGRMGLGSQTNNSAGTGQFAISQQIGGEFLCGRDKSIVVVFATEAAAFKIHKML